MKNRFEVTTTFQFKNSEETSSTSHVTTSMAKAKVTQKSCEDWVKTRGHKLISIEIKEV